MATQTGTPMGTKQIFETVHVSWGWMMALGIIMLIVGSVAIIFPAATSVSIEVLLGILLLIGGVARFFTIFTSRGMGQFVLRLLGAVVFVIAGVMLLVYPLGGTITLTMLLAAYFIIQGILGIIIAASSSSEKGWGWVLFNGIVALILGGLIWAGLPSSAAWAIGLLVGIQLILEGWMLIMASMAVHAEETHGHMPMTA